MSFPLYFDEHVAILLARLLRQAGFDVVTAPEAGLAGRGIPDDVQLEYAAGQGRVLFSHDLKTMALAAQRSLDRGLAHSGVVLCGQRPLDELKERFELLLMQYDAEQMRNVVIWLPPLPSRRGT